MEIPLFLLGAGFNADAPNEAGPLNVSCSYPLARDLAKICFDLELVPQTTSVEQLFQEAMKQGNLNPLKKLYGALMKADYYIAGVLSMSSNKACNAYTKFLKRFEDSSFLTFNYDSLVEIMLLRLKRWRPEDGYGVPVRTELRPSPHVPELPNKSKNIVLHLHGSLCLFTSDFYFQGEPGDKVRWLIQRNKPEFLFDPDMIGALFFPFDRVPPITSYVPIEERVIAPVPNKAEGLKGSFIFQVYKRSLELIGGAKTIVSIGYNYGLFDRESSAMLLKTASQTKATLILVGPSAEKIIGRLQVEYPNLAMKAVPLTFQQWTATDFEGLR